MKVFEWIITLEHKDTALQYVKRDRFSGQYDELLHRARAVSKCTMRRSVLLVRKASNLCGMYSYENDLVERNRIKHRHELMRRRARKKQRLLCESSSQRSWKYRRTCHVSIMRERQASTKQEMLLSPQHCCQQTEVPYTVKNSSLRTNSLAPLSIILCLERTLPRDSDYKC
jgi:hypothetical protein